MVARHLLVCIEECRLTFLQHVLNADDIVVGTVAKRIIEPLTREAIDVVRQVVRDQGLTELLNAIRRR